MSLPLAWKMVCQMVDHALFQRLRTAALAALVAAIVAVPLVLIAAESGPDSGDAMIGGLPGQGALSPPVAPELLGASGVLPQDDAVSPLVATSSAGAAVVTAGPRSIPPVVRDAYVRAERALAEQQPQCGISWQLLAGLGRVVSDHARGGGLDERGTMLSPVLGPRLNGTRGVARVEDTDGGRLDRDRTWDRAVGPMQFLPSVWQRVGGGGDPHNVSDAALAAGRFLCEQGADLRTPGGQVSALFRYQRSEAFVRAAMLWARAYGAPSVAVLAGPAPTAQSAAAGSRPAPLRQDLAVVGPRRGVPDSSSMSRAGQPAPSTAAPPTSITAPPSTTRLSAPPPPSPPLPPVGPVPDDPPDDDPTVNSSAG